VVLKGDAKSIDAVATAMFRLIQANYQFQRQVIRLRCDHESAFVQPKARQAFSKIGIHEIVPVSYGFYTQYPQFMEDKAKIIKQDNNHRSLAIIDRVIRTFRDMAYNLHIGVIGQEDMAHIVKIYNDTPHNTLSRLMGFDVTPAVAEADMKLQQEIRRRLLIQNYKITHSDGYDDIRADDRVYVYNEHQQFIKRRSPYLPDIYTVLDVGVRENPKITSNFIKGNQYLLINARNETVLMPRWKLRKI
jgi:hypothetical protein